MREKATISTILLLAIFALVPSWFANGAIFDATALKINDCGDVVVIHGIYFDNVFFFLMYLTLSYLLIIIPIFAKKLHWSMSALSFFVGGWFSAGLIGEIINFQTPLLVTNSAYDMGIFNKFLICFVLGLISIIAFTAWKKTSK